MPGVPSSTGCLACRKLKKKCEGDSPPCLRCRKTSTRCEGMGQRRFKFLPTATQTAPNIPIRTDTTTTSLSRNRKNHEKLPLIPCAPSESPSSRLAISLVASLGHAHDNDIRYQLWNFGLFLGDIPCRLGFSRALDDSSEALVAAYAAFRTRLPCAYRHCLQRYSRAIVSLRNALDDKASAQSSETLASTMVLMIFETLIGSSDASIVSHAGGASRILRCRGSVKPRDDFETVLFHTLRGPVIVQSLLDPKPSFTPREWTELVEDGLDNEEVHINPLPLLARYTNLHRQVRTALQSPTPDLVLLDGLRRRTDALLQSCDRPTIEQIVLLALNSKNDGDGKSTTDQSPYPHPSPDSGPSSPKRVDILRIACFANTALVLTLLLSASLAPCSERCTLLHDAAERSAEMCTLMGEALAYKPLGTIYATFVYGVAFAGSESEGTKREIVESIAHAKSGFLGPRAPLPYEELDKAARHIRLDDVRSPRTFDLFEDLNSHVLEVGKKSSGCF